MNSKLNKRKATMLIYTIEEAFGNFVKDKLGDVAEIPEQITESLGKRRLSTKAEPFEGISNILESTYLNEIFQLAEIATKGTSLAKIIAEIKDLAVFYSLYEIRNAVSHPNRPFIDCYWYKLASFACEPVIQILGLTDIQNCIMSAEKGIISDPPEEWFIKQLFEIRNNLPLEFDHEITGLIGREEESKKLLKLLKNPQ